MRHHVLAWLAAEGLSSTLVTTNYDLLVDCAYRLAGMFPLAPPPDLWREQEIPRDRAHRLRLPMNRRYRHFSRVAEATQFFAHGEAHESAVIHKIHGCVETYARALAKLRVVFPSRLDDSRLLSTARRMSSVFVRQDAG